MTSYMIRPKEHTMTPATRNSIKAGAWTTLFSFLTLFAVTLLGWLQDVVEWAAASGASGQFPDLSPLGYGAVSAAAAAAIGLVNFAVRFIQGHTSLPGSPPDYTGEPVD